MNFVTCNQTHSDNIHIVKQTDIGKVIKNCDGLITNLSNITISIKTADCLPISIEDKVKKVIGVIHAGWKGTEKEIIKKAIKLMIKNFKSNPEDIEIFIGPAIDKDNYLVRKDVANGFLDKFPECLERVNDDQWKLDLVKINILQLLEIGILKKNMKLSNISTFKDKNYPSYRRDGKSDGFETRMMLK